jgi:phosphatidylglycerophosphate synthase
LLVPARDLFMLPNVLSAARVPLGVLFVFVAHRPPLAIAVLAVAALTDVLDGWSARRTHHATALGAIVDGIADKIFAGCVLGSLLVLGLLSPAGALLLATRELCELPLAVRILARRASRQSKVDRAANTVGKAATALEFAAVVAVLTRSSYDHVLIGVAGGFGAVAGASYWVREIRASREERKRQT